MKKSTILAVSDVQANASRPQIQEASVVQPPSDPVAEARGTFDPFPCLSRGRKNRDARGVNETLRFLGTDTMMGQQQTGRSDWYKGGEE